MMNPKIFNTIMQNVEKRVGLIDDEPEAGRSIEDSKTMEDRLDHIAENLDLNDSYHVQLAGTLIRRLTTERDMWRARAAENDALITKWKNKADSLEMQIAPKDGAIATLQIALKDHNISMSAEIDALTTILREFVQWHQQEPNLPAQEAEYQLENLARRARAFIDHD